MRKLNILLLGASILGLIFSGNILAQSKKLSVPDRGFISSTVAETWEEGLISGNGTIGINILSDPLDETIIFTHERLFRPQHPPHVPPNKGHMLFEIRRLIDMGLYEQATKLSFQLSEQKDIIGGDPFIPAFDMNLTMEADGEVDNYMRSVDFQTGEATVHWTDDRGVFERKMFVSRTDGLAIMQVTGPAGAVNFELGIGPRRPSNKMDAWKISNSYKVFQDNISNMETTTNEKSVEHKYNLSKAYPGSVHSVEAIAMVVKNDGKLTTGKQSLSIKGASSVLVLIDLELLYNPEKSVVEEMRETMFDLPHDYTTLLNRHARIHGEMFSRMKLDLGGDKKDHKLTTEELIASSSNENMNMALFEKLFDAARYNIISCVGELPPNLQGVWGGTYNPPWHSDFTHNGNVPSAIASLLMGNMPELMRVYTSFIESQIPYMEINAKHMFGARGIVLPSHSTTRAYNTLICDWFPGSFWVAGAPWAAHFFYDYYLYTDDKDFLKNHALPFMEKAALFFEDYLYENSEGIYVFSPGQSPENIPSNSNSQACFNATMDVAAAKELLRNLISASQELGLNQNKIETWKSMLEKMPKYMINEDGIIKEWLTPKLENNDYHRHASQMYPLYYGMPDEIKNSQELQNAFKKSVIFKLEKHWRNDDSGFMAFGLVQLGQVASSLGEGELVYECLQHLANRFWFDNLASTHNHRSIFNMDISGGMPAVIIKMLVESEPGIVRLLPALPKKFNKGTIEGVLCRGAIEIKNLSWESNSITVTMVSQKDQDIELRLPLAVNELRTVKGNGKIAEIGDTHSRKISMIKNEPLTLNLSMK